MFRWVKLIFRTFPKIYDWQCEKIGDLWIICRTFHRFGIRVCSRLQNLLKLSNQIKMDMDKDEINRNYQLFVHLSMVAVYSICWIFLLQPTKFLYLAINISSNPCRVLQIICKFPIFFFRGFNKVALKHKFAYWLPLVPKKCTAHHRRLDNTDNSWQHCWNVCCVDKLCQTLTRCYAHLHSKGLVAWHLTIW